MKKLHSSIFIHKRTHAQRNHKLLSGCRKCLSFSPDLSAKIAFDHIGFRGFYDIVAIFPTIQLVERARIELILLLLLFFIVSILRLFKLLSLTHATITFKVNARTQTNVLCCCCCCCCIIEFMDFGEHTPNRFRSHQVQLLASDTRHPNDEFDFYKMVYLLLQSYQPEIIYRIPCEFRQ